MIIEDETTRIHLGVFVEGPAWGDADFYGNWLLAAAKAEAFWKEALQDSDFAKQIDRLMVVYIFDFGMAATMFLARLQRHYVSFVVNCNEELEVDEFVMMVGMGFFVRSGSGYRMAIPDNLNLATVKSTAIAYAQTEDGEGYLHPESLIFSLPFSEAIQIEQRQLAICDFQRRDYRRIEQYH